MLNQLGQISMNAHDIDRATAFYADTLKVKLLFRAGKMSFFYCAGVRLMLSVAEVVGIPMILMIFFGWARNDIRHATVVDAELEAERPTRTAPGVAQPPPLERPWWESDPRFRNPRS